MVDVSVNGVWISSIGLKLVGRTLPPLPEAEEFAVKIAGRDGEYDFGTTYGPRMIRLDVYVMDDFHPTIARVAAMFNAKRGNLEIKFSDLPGKRYMTKFRGTLDFDSSSVNHMLTIPLKMDDPFPESELEKVVETLITRSNPTRSEYQMES